MLLKSIIVDSRYSTYLLFILKKTKKTHYTYFSIMNFSLFEMLCTSSLVTNLYIHVVNLCMFGQVQNILYNLRNGNSMYTIISGTSCISGFGFIRFFRMSFCNNSIKQHADKCVCTCCQGLWTRGQRLRCRLCGHISLWLLQKKQQECLTKCNCYIFTQKLTCM